MSLSFLSEAVCTRSMLEEEEKVVSETTILVKVSEVGIFDPLST